MNNTINFEQIINAYTAGYSPRGRENKLACLRRWSVWAAEHQIDPVNPARTDLDRYRGYLIGLNQMPRSVNSHLSILRSWAKWMMQENYWATNPAQYLELLPHPNQVTLKWLTDEELAHFLDYVDEAADPTMRGYIYVMAFHGTRPQETRLLDQRDVNFFDQTIAIRHRKDGRNSSYTMPDPVAAALRPLHTESSTDPLFINANTGLRISKSISQQRFNDLVAGAGIPPITPYGLRASFITNALAAGVSERDVQAAAGHVSPMQTVLYDQAREAHASVAQFAAAQRIADLRKAA
jgi:integrase